MIELVGYKMVRVFRIIVDIQANEEDWSFVWIDMGNGKKQMSIF